MCINVLNNIHQVLCINIITIKLKNKNYEVKATKTFTQKHIKTKCEIFFVLSYYFLNNNKLHMY
jgi:hypothetical protein